MSHQRSLIVAPLAFIFSAAVASAQTEPPTGGPVQQAAQPAAREDVGLTVELRARGSFTFSSDIDDTEGDVGIARAGVGVSIGIKAWERARLSLGIDEEVSWYLFDDAMGLIPSMPADADPFELGLITTFSPRLSVQHNENWSWYVGGIIEFAGDPDADLGDSGTYGGYGGARYAFSDEFGLSFGIAAKSRLEDDTIVIPLIGIDWKITDRVTFSTEGTTAKLGVELNDQWTAALTAGWELRDYRLDDDASVPDGVMSDERIPIGLTFEWRPNPDVTISLTGGAVVWQEFEFRDDGGNDVSETNTDPAPFVGLSAQFRF